MALALELASDPPLKPQGSGAVTNGVVSAKPSQALVTNAAETADRGDLEATRDLESAGMGRRGKLERLEMNGDGL